MISETIKINGLTYKQGDKGKYFYKSAISGWILAGDQEAIRCQFNADEKVLRPKKKAIAIRAAGTPTAFLKVMADGEARTAREVAKITGIYSTNADGVMGGMKHRGKVKMAGRRVCLISKHVAQTYVCA
tara:strand:- start:68 stop:454 length:387 start_codon:yes stop_codon:yes gene_type:complete